MLMAQQVKILLSFAECPQQYELNFTSYKERRKMKNDMYIFERIEKINELIYISVYS